jgi:FAD/FMN-containing dehydrogenase
MNSVSLSGDVATIGAGTRLGELYAALGRHGRTVAAGCGDTVGISGLALGGGIGILGRRYGLTSDQVLAAQLVLADGRVVECDDERDAELFWALRGAGGGNFGVVTSLVLRTVQAPAATAFAVTWPNADVVAVVAAWQAWGSTGPDELAASLVVHVEGGVDAPTPTVFGAMHGVESDAAQLLDALAVRVGTDPDAASFTYAPFQDAKRELARLGARRQRTNPAYPLSKSEFFGQPLPAGAVMELVVQLGQAAPGDYRELDFSPLLGAYDRTPPDATAYVHRHADFLLKHAATVDADAPAAAAEEAQSCLARSWNTTHSWGSGHAYQNFPDPDLTDWPQAYYGANLARLRRVKHRYDPNGFFHFAQSL